MKYFTLLILASFILSACGAKPGTPGGKVSDFSSDTDSKTTDQITTYTDKLANTKVTFSQTKKLNEEFQVKYKTFNPEGEGYVVVKAKSLKSVDSIDEVKPDSGKKLYVLELAVKGNTKNKGEPSTFNQVGDHPSPQFVMVDTSKNITYVEETPFSDAYTLSHKQFELSKLTLDGDQWVNTSIVFQLDQALKPDLAFRFINVDNKPEFYNLNE